MPSNPVPPSPLASQGTRGATTLALVIERLEFMAHNGGMSPPTCVATAKDLRTLLPASPPSAEAPTTCPTCPTCQRCLTRINDDRGALWYCAEPTCLDVPAPAVPPSADAGETRAEKYRCRHWLNPTPYLDGRDAARERVRLGEVQSKCPRCGLWLFPDEVE